MAESKKRLKRQPPQLDDVFHLLKPHSANWQNIGRALSVSKKYRDELLTQGVLKNNDSKLEDVLDRWIESQCSEVSWDHLIEVLQDDLKMADTVSKIKEYLLNNDKAKEKYQWKNKSGGDNVRTLDVFRLLEDKARHWDSIGRELGVDLIYREILRRDISLSDEARLEMILNKWMESECSPVSWHTIDEMMRRLGFDDLLPQVQKYLPSKDDAAEFERDYTNVRPQLKSGDNVRLIDVFRLLMDKASHWDNIGRELRVPMNDREMLRRDISLSYEARLERILNKWMESECSPVSWHTIDEIIRRLGFDDLLPQVQKYLPSKEHDSSKEEHDSSKEEHRLMKLAKEGIINGRHVRLRALKGILIGGPGVGKTITFKRLTNRRGNIEKDGHSSSTGVEKPDTVHLYRDIENTSVLIGKHWSPQPLEGQLSTYLHCLQRQNQPPSAIGTAPTTSQTPNISGRSNMTTEPIPKESNQSSGSVSKQPRDQRKAIDVQKISSLLKQGKLEDVEKMIEEMGEITVLYMMDLGGQPEYFEILPLLLHGPFLGIIFINLSLSLTEPFEVTYRHTESTHSAISYTASYCQIDMVHQVLALIDALCPDHATQSSTTIKSHACLIGTHKDASNVDSSTISAFEKKIKESLKGTELYYLLQMLYRKNYKANFIFPIDNRFGDENEIEKLRKALTDQIYNKFESEEINIRWGIFHLLLRSQYEKAGVCSLDEAVQLGLTCGLQNESNVTDVLKYLHFRFGTILYYDDVTTLSNRVICDPNLIFRPLTEIIADSFGAAQHNPQIAEEIRETGIVPIEIFNEACKKNNADHKLLTDDIVELLKHHNILSEIAQNGESVLFMPCLLQPYSASDDDQQQSKDDYCNALLFTFTPYGFQPIGLFYALTAKLLSSNDFELACVRFRNKIGFMFGDACIEITSMFRYLEVRIDGFCSSPRRVALRSILHDQIESIMMNLPHTKNIEVDVLFYCPVSIDKNDPHPAELQHVKQMDITEKPRVLKCNNCRKGFKKRVELTREQEMWFEDPCQGVATEKTLKDPVDPLTAFQLTKCHSSHWEDIGRNLGVPQNDRDIIKQERVKVNSRLEAVLNKWIESHEGPPRWMTLITALRGVGLIALAETIKAKYLSVM